MVSMSPIGALIFCAVAASCGGSAGDDPAASSDRSASESEIPESDTPESETTAPALQKCTTEFHSECIEVWVDGRTVPVGRDETRAQFVDEDAPTVYALDFSAVDGTGDRLKLPSGYEPQTNRSGTGFYLDYVLSKPLEAGTERQPYRHQGVNYSRSYVNSPQFKPLTTEAEIKAAVGTGKIARIDSDQTPYWSQSDTVHLFSPTR